MGLSPAAVSSLRAEVPLDPDAEEARRLVIEELAKPEYRAAEPSWFDRAVVALREWFASLEVPVAEGGPPLGWIVVIAVVAVVVVVALLVYGLPRLNRRSSVTGSLFGDDDQRTADQLRDAARRAAGSGDWSAAVLDGYRAIAKGLAERTVLSVSPGTTAHEVAVRAGRAVPAEAGALEAAAGGFDRVRYLDGTATEQDWLAIAALDARLQAARPDLAAAEAPLAGTAVPR